MRFGCGYPMGPLALLDLIGLDTAYEILDTMYKQGRNRLHAPSPIIKQMVSAGLLAASPAVASTPTPRRAPRRWSPTRRRRPEALPPGVSLRPVTSVGVVGSGTMATGIIEVFAKAGYAVTYVARGDDKVEGGARRPGAQHRAGGREGPDDGRGRRGAARPGDRRDHARGAGGRRPRRRGRSPRTWRSSRPSSRPRPICKPGAILATTTSSLPIIDCARSPRAPPTSSGCTSSTRPR